MNFPVRPTENKDKVPVVHPEALQFLPDAQEIELTPLPLVARLTTITIISLLIFLILWACISDVDIVVNARGKLVSSGKDLTIAALNDSVIKTIDVKVGQIVKANEILVTLDPTFAVANESQMRFKHTRVLLVLDRLKSELNGKPFASSLDPSSAEYISQKAILRERNDEYNAKLRSFDSKISEVQSNISSLEKQASTSSRQESISREVMQMREKVFNQGVDSKLSYLDAQNNHANIVNNNERVKKDLLASRKQLAQIQAEREAYISQRRSILSQEMAEMEKELSSITEELAKAVRMKELATLTAPVSAMVIDIRKFPSDSVVKTGEPIMVLAPLQTPLEAEVYIEPRDIGFIRANDPAAMKLEAFPYHRHGIIYGKLRTVGEDSLVKDNGNHGPVTYYPARLEINDTSRLKNLPSDFRLMPGMTLESSITVGQRKVITYLLYPILRAIDDSIRER
jgi:HlyD family secretion protein